MIRLNYYIWFIALTLAILVSACAPGALQSPVQSLASPTPPAVSTAIVTEPSSVTSVPLTLTTTTQGQREGWKRIVGAYVTFECPQSWNPTPEPLNSGGVILESWRLGISGGGPDQDLGFSDVSPQEARSADIISERAIIIGGKPGFKWIRSGPNYVHYDYITTGYDDQGSFSAEVGVAQPDTVLEAQLDRLVQSIVFNK